jgi:hypothetical protein
MRDYRLCLILYGVWLLERKRQRETEIQRTRKVGPPFNETTHKTN